MSRPNKEHLAILNQGVEVWNRWRAEVEVPPERSFPWLCGANLSGVNLSGANLSGEYMLLCHTDFSGADLSNANLSCANISHSNLSGANLSGADLNAANLGSTDFDSANLSNARLERAHLDHACLASANLSGATLNFANLEQADLSYADLSGARLYGSDFIYANLHSANLSHATLINAKLKGVNLKGANLQCASVRDTMFLNCDLSKALGLDLVEHGGPSVIDIATIYRSKGTISAHFLRESGVPEGFIRAMSSFDWVAEGIQFYSCFISYSTKDEEFAYALRARMRDASLRVWFAPEDIRGGQKLYEQIKAAIHDHDKLLIVISEASLRSGWVRTELREALMTTQNQNGKRKLFPVRLVDFETLRNWECFDADSGKDLGVELREYFIPDFSNWKDHDSFEAAFDRLLQDLRADSNAE